MWSETVGLRTRPVSDLDQNNRPSVLLLVLVLVLRGLVTLVVIMILKDTETFQVLSLFIVSRSVLCLKHHYCGDQQWRLLIST